MSFENFLDQAWNDHASQPERVAERLPAAFELLEKEEQIPQLAHLIGHVLGEHLGRWDLGIRLLNGLQQSTHFKPNSEAERSLFRLTASLSLASDEKNWPEDFSRSDQIRILAVAASALSGQNQTARATAIFKKALDLAQEGLEKNDPANRALAVTGNNLACALEEKATRDAEDLDLMITAAKTGRQYWAIAGGWNEVQVAEYRLAMSYIQAQDFLRASEHAQNCIEICETNSAGPMDMFYDHEAKAYSEQGQKNQTLKSNAIAKAMLYFEKLSPENQSLCEKAYEKLRAHWTFQQ